jgi:putative transposase
MNTERGRPRPPVSPDGHVRGASASDKAPAHHGWHERGYLAHCDVPHVIQSITYRLADSLPKDVLLRMEAEAQSGATDEERSRILRRRIDAWLDGGHGACLLRDPAIAGMIIDNWRHFDPERYRLEAFVVMPNHVHVLIAIKEGVSLSDVVRSWKTYSAKQIARITDWKGTVWQADYWDRYIRDAEHYQRAMAYILANPVKAGLAKETTEWPWSSVAR